MKYLFFVVITLFSITVQANDFCQNVNNKIGNEKVYFPSPLETYRIIGKGRLYFYSAPDKKCKISNNLFIIPNDIVIPYFEYNNYYYVGYMNNIDISGWVYKNRLQPTGEYIGPTDDR